MVFFRRSASSSAPGQSRFSPTDHRQPASVAERLAGLLAYSQRLPVAESSKTACSAYNIIRAKTKVIDALNRIALFVLLNDWLIDLAHFFRAVFAKDADNSRGVVNGGDVLNENPASLADCTGHVVDKVEGANVAFLLAARIALPLVSFDLAPVKRHRCR